MQTLWSPRYWDDRCGEADNKNCNVKTTTGISDVSLKDGILPSSSCAEDHGHNEHHNSFAKPCSPTPTTILELEQKDNKIQEHSTAQDQRCHSDDFPAYMEDMLPDNVEHTKLTKRYKAIKEEFYIRTDHKPVTPSNFTKWMTKMKGRGIK